MRSEIGGITQSTNDRLVAHMFSTLATMEHMGYCTELSIVVLTETITAFFDYDTELAAINNHLL